MDKVSSRHVTWIDIENPTEQDITGLTKKFPIHPLAMQEILTITHRPKLEDFDDHLYLVLHFPVFDPKSGATLSREIDFIIFPYNLITVHYDDVPQLDDFQQLLATHEALRERKFGSSSGHLLYHIISQLFSISLKELEKIEDRIEIVQDKVFSGEEKDVLQDIARLRRDLLNFQKALKPQQTVLASLTEHGRHFFGTDILPFFNDIKGEYTQVWNSVEDLRETLDVIYETNISLLSANTNDATRILTAFAAILLPAALIINIFGMNIKDIPLGNNPHAFWIILGFMVTISLFIYRYFKNKQWF
ncbi:MAG: magnesium transporter CorA family protein [Patescibacteria group bacterium]